MLDLKCFPDRLEGFNDCSMSMPAGDLEVVSSKIHAHNFTFSNFEPSRLFIVLHSFGKIMSRVVFTYFCHIFLVAKSVFPFQVVDAEPTTARSAHFRFNANEIHHAARGWRLIKVKEVVLIIRNDLVWVVTLGRLSHWICRTV